MSNPLDPGASYAIDRVNEIFRDRIHAVRAERENPMDQTIECSNCGREVPAEDAQDCPTCGDASAGPNPEPAFCSRSCLDSHHADYHEPRSLYQLRAERYAEEGAGDE